MLSRQVTYQTHFGKFAARWRGQDRQKFPTKFNKGYARLNITHFGDVYRARNKINGKAYIGITKRGCLLRQEEHIKGDPRGLHRPFYRAIRKYGRSAFVFEHIASAKTEKDLLALEPLLVEQEGTLAPAGYNLCKGGRGVLSPSDETRARMRAWKRDGRHSRNRWSDPDYKERTARNMSLAHTGKKRSPEHVEAARQGNLRRHVRTRFLKECRKVERECRVSIRAAYTVFRQEQQRRASQRLKDIKDHAQHIRLVRERERIARWEDQIRRRVVAWCCAKHLEGELGFIIQTAVRDGARREDLIETLNTRGLLTVGGERWSDGSVRDALKMLGIKRVYARKKRPALSARRPPKPPKVRARTPIEKRLALLERHGQTMSPRLRMQLLRAVNQNKPEFNISLVA